MISNTPYWLYFKINDIDLSKFVNSVFVQVLYKSLGLLHFNWIFLVLNELTFISAIYKLPPHKLKT